MSGHSKWAQIKRQKGVADIKRGQAFTKLANAITIAVRGGGGISDPEANFKLRLVIDRARASNMPKENIERAINRGQGRLEGTDLEEVVYEGFAPSGVAVIIEAVTDNKQRTASEIKNVFAKNGGTLGSPGAVSYLFRQEGVITIHKNGKFLDDILLLAADSEAEDIEDIGTDSVLVYTVPSDVKKTEEVFKNSGLRVESAELIRRPITTMMITDKGEAKKILSFIEKLEELGDVQKVYANFDNSTNLL